MTKTAYTLITGASSGIGKAMAIECAKKGMQLLLIALPDSNLRQTAGFLAKRYKIQVLYYGINLAQDGSCEKIDAWLRAKKLPVNILINNAGIGSSGTFENYSPEFYKQQIYLNTIVPTLLIRLLIKELKSHKSAHIMNVGSLGGYFHLPYKNVYSATKSYMISFSHSLRNELRGSGVSVSALCPGPVNTNEEVRALNRKLGWIGKKLVKSPEDIAQVAIKRMLKKKRLIIPGRLSRFLLFISKITPNNIKGKLIANERRKNAEYFEMKETRLVHKFAKAGDPGSR